MTPEQKEALSRAKAHVASLGYMEVEISRVRTEDIKSILSIIDTQSQLLSNLKSDLSDLKTFMIEADTWERFEGSMIQSMILSLEE